MLGSELDEQLAEEYAVLGRPFRPHQAPAAGPECPGDVVLHVLSRRQDAALLPGQHPIATHLRIEVDVDLVGVVDRLAAAVAVRQLFQLA